MTDKELSKTWELYEKNQSRELRDRLIINYSPLIKLVAGRLSMYMHDYIDQEELESYGIFGLIDAIDKFSTSKGVKFETYASLRIRGAILDNIRKLDWVPRSVRQKQKDVNNIKTKLRYELDREPTDKEVANELGVSEDEYVKLKSQTDITNLLYLEDVKDDNGEVRNIAENIKQNTYKTPEESAIRRVIVEQIQKSLEKLTDNERKVIMLYYYEELTLREISSIIEVSESRVSQIHSRALEKMRENLGEFSDIVYRL